MTKGDEAKPTEEKGILDQIMVKPQVKEEKQCTLTRRERPNSSKKWGKDRDATEGVRLTG